MSDHFKGESVFDQIEQYAHDQALLGPILKEAREDRDEIKRLRAALTQIVAVCDDNRADDQTSSALALKFVRDVAAKAGAPR